MGGLEVTMITSLTKDPHTEVVLLFVIRTRSGPLTSIWFLPIAAPSLNYPAGIDIHREYSTYNRTVIVTLASRPPNDLSPILPASRTSANVP